MTLAPLQPQAIMRTQQQRATGTVPHIDLAQVALLAQATEAAAIATGRPQNGERNALLILTLCDGALRVSEAVGYSRKGSLVGGLHPVDLLRTPEGWLLAIEGKGGKPRHAAISPSLAARLQSYAYRYGLAALDRFFPISRYRAWAILTEAFKATGIQKPAHVGAVHVLRHSGALWRLSQSGNPKAVQDQLGHLNGLMTLRYMKTLSAEESLRINQGLEAHW